MLISLALTAPAVFPDNSSSDAVTTISASCPALARASVSARLARSGMLTAPCPVAALASKAVSRAASAAAVAATAASCSSNNAISSSSVAPASLAASTLSCVRTRTSRSAFFATLSAALAPSTACNSGVTSSANCAFGLGSACALVFPLAACSAASVTICSACAALYASTPSVAAIRTSSIARVLPERARGRASLILMYAEASLLSGGGSAPSGPSSSGATVGFLGAGGGLGGVRARPGMAISRASCNTPPATPPTLNSSAALSPILRFGL